MKIYTVTAGSFITRKTVYYKHKGETVFIKVEPYIYFSDRNFGFYGTLEEAERAVLDNEMDFHEDSNDFACISGVEEGIYTSSYMSKGSKIFYEWQDKDGIRCRGDEGSYIRLETEPQELKEYYKNIVGYMEPFG